MNILTEHASDCARRFHSAAECTCPYAEIVEKNCIHNDINHILVDMSEKQGWDENSQIQHLCGFISWIRCNFLHEMEKHELHYIFQAYLQDIADDENGECE